MRISTGEICTTLGDVIVGNLLYWGATLGTAWLATGDKWLPFKQGRKSSDREMILLFNILYVLITRIILLSSVRCTQRRRPLNVFRVNALRELNLGRMIEVSVIRPRLNIACSS